MKRFLILRKVLNRTKANIIVGIFVIFVFAVALAIYFIEPTITSYGDALWYCYANLFTIGFGDIVPLTTVGRILSVILTVYATVVIAVVTGVIVAFYNEILSFRYKESREVILDKLCNLPDLSKEELEELSNKVKEIKK